MHVSAKSEYGCLAMLELAARYFDPKPVRLGDVADKHRIPQRFLVQIMLQLKGAGLITTTRGASGGYLLTRPPDRITLAEILAVLEPTDGPSERGAAFSDYTAVLNGVWDRLTASREQILSTTTLADLVKPRGGFDYII